MKRRKEQEGRLSLSQCSFWDTRSWKEANIFSKGENPIYPWQFISFGERLRAGLDLQVKKRSCNQWCRTQPALKGPGRPVSGVSRVCRGQTEPDCMSCWKQRWGTDRQQGGHGREFHLKHQLVLPPSSQRPSTPIDID